MTISTISPSGEQGTIIYTNWLSDVFVRVVEFNTSWQVQSWGNVDKEHTLEVTKDIPKAVNSGTVYITEAMSVANTLNENVIVAKIITEEDIDKLEARFNAQLGVHENRIVHQLQIGGFWRLRNDVFSGRVEPNDVEDHVISYIEYLFSVYDA